MAASLAEGGSFGARDLALAVLAASGLLGLDQVRAGGPGTDQRALPALLQLSAACTGVMHARLHAHPMHSLHQPQVSAALPLLQGAVGFPLPPLLAAGMQAVGTLPVALTNGRTCSSDMMQHPAAAPHLRALYRWLEPAVAPLEPLLLGAGVGRAHPHRHCHCSELLLWL